MRNRTDRICGDRRLGYTAVFITMFLCLLKGTVGVIGSSEALAADGLWSFVHSVFLVKTLFSGYGRLKQSLAVGGAVIVVFFINKIILVGIGDIAIFSAIRIGKAVTGTLVRPSPWTLYVAILSVLVNGYLYRCCRLLRPESQEDVPRHTDWYDYLRLSTAISMIAIVGIVMAGTVWLSGDAVASLLILVILIPVGLKGFWRTLKSVLDLIFYGSRVDLHVEGVDPAQDGGAG